MIYLDYAAHTPASKAVLDVFYETEQTYLGNPNSRHLLGQQAWETLETASRKIRSLLGLDSWELIFTSGATESNNLAIFGSVKEHRGRGKHLISSYLEHSSVTGSLTALQNQGYELDFVRITPQGEVDLSHLKELLREDTALLSLSSVDSEVGTILPLEKITQLLKVFPNCIFHVDATQSIGKVDLDYSQVDLLTFSGHKIFGLSGSGCLLKKSGIPLAPIHHGGISTTPYRSGTPALGLNLSLQKALEEMLLVQKENSKVVEINQLLRKGLAEFSKVEFNTPKEGSPYLLNISLKGVHTDAFAGELSKQGIILSTKSACCAPYTPSRPVYALTGDRKRALSTLRISISHLTTKEEATEFLRCFALCYEEIGRKA